MKKLFILLLVSAILIPLEAFSATAPTTEQAAATAVETQAQAAPAVTAAAPTKGQYPAGPIQKLERGFMNAAYGWTEIPKRVVDKTKESNPVKGVLLGTWQGTCRAFARTASGVAEMLTFPIGRYDKPRVLADMPAAQ